MVKCDCGCATIYGADTNLHANWCSIRTNVPSPEWELFKYQNTYSSYWTDYWVSDNYKKLESSYVITASQARMRITTELSCEYWIEATLPEKNELIKLCEAYSRKYKIVK